MAIILLSSMALTSVGGMTSSATPFSATFDFNKGQPTVIPGQNTPFNHMSNGVTAYFTSPSDPDAFSVQNYGTTFYVLSEFSGNSLYDNKPLRNTLEIRFSRPITEISLVFATLEYHGGPSDRPTELIPTAYMGSTSQEPVGTATSRGSWPSGSTFPEGTLSYSSGGKPFDIVRIGLAGNGVAVDFLVDNVTFTGMPADTEYPPPSELGSGFPLGYTIAGAIGVVALAVVLVWRWRVRAARERALPS